MAAGLLASVPRIPDLLTGWRLISSIAGILVLASLAGRLLGTRRSAAAVVVSGLSGWLAGAALAVVVARNHEHSQAGFVRNLWLFAAFFTMSTTVWIEMLAKSGALTRAQQSLTSFPRPWRSVRRRSRRVSRYGQIVRIMARHGLGPFLGIGAPADDSAAGRAPVPVRVRRALEDAGGMFVKLGQVLSTRADLIPPDLARELARLQDQVGPESRQDIERVLDEDLGRPLGRLFAEFDWEPAAAASIGQAYRAERRTGERVIVKVQRPGVADSVACDLDVLAQLGHTLEARVSWAREYRVFRADRAVR